MPYRNIVAYPGAIQYTVAVAGETYCLSEKNAQLFFHIHYKTNPQNKLNKIILNLKNKKNLLRKKENA